MLDKRLDLVLGDRFRREPERNEPLVEEALDEGEVLAGLHAVDRLETDVALRVGLHVGEGTREGEETGSGRVLDEVTDGTEEEPEV